MKNWLKHVWNWLSLVILDFPIPRTDYHAWHSRVGGEDEECWTCGAKVKKSEEDLEWDREILRKHPEWKELADEGD